MAVKLQDKQNVDAPDGTYPYGKIRDRAGAVNGTPIDAAVYGDFHQFFAQLLEKSGVVANGLPENLTNGFQYFEALLRSVGIKQSANLNSQVYPGVFFIKATDTNRPTNISSAAQLIVSVDESAPANVWQRAHDLSNGAVWVRSSSNSGSSWSAWLLIKFAEKYLDIGPFNCMAGASVSLAHGLSLINIRGLSGWIRPDNLASSGYPVETLDTGGLLRADPTSVDIIFTSSGRFDDANFSSLAHNRGNVIIQYVP